MRALFLFTWYLCVCCFTTVCSLQMQCYQCEETLLNNDCSTAKFIVNCTANIQDACQKEVMVDTHGVLYRKACASYTTCLIASAGYQRFCSPGRLGSVCISCCNTPLCNGPRPPHTHSTAHTHSYTHPHQTVTLLTLLTFTALTTPTP
ncbi:ly6/PLAUR domain-containing protein 1-like [Trichomycterus rosablanca]|uniref:ly6/PLAUR domain-containing protein 1-like n=1 Tax=Trichomycterus rosablanca TaxID=2290929 RepID=UPI002F35F8DD